MSAKKIVDAEVVRRAAEAGLSVAEIGRIVDCTPRTLHRRFQKELSAGNERGVASLKLRLHQKAMAGSNAALIFSLKNRAGWSDRHALTGPTGGPIEHEGVSHLTDAELQRIVDAELRRTGLAAEVETASDPSAR